MAVKMERPSLTGLPLKKKPALAATPTEDKIEDAQTSREDQKSDGKVPVMVRMTRADRKMIRQIAIGIDTTVQALIEDAIHDIIRRHRGALHL